MGVMGEIQLEMCYYNEKLAVWEPLLEPVMEIEDNYRPWEILVKVILKNNKVILMCM